MCSRFSFFVPVWDFHPLSLTASLCLFVVILLTMVNALLLDIVDRSQVLGFHGIGGTEGRLLGFIWVGVVHFGGFERTQFNLETTTGWDIIASGGMLVMLVLLGITLLRRITEYSKQEVLLPQLGTEQASSDLKNAANHREPDTPILLPKLEAVKSKAPRMTLQSAPNTARNRRRI
jgi:hypothetical protein